MDIVDNLRIMTALPMDPRFRSSITQAADEIERLRSLLSQARESFKISAEKMDEAGKRKALPSIWRLSGDIDAALNTLPKEGE